MVSVGLPVNIPSQKSTPPMQLSGCVDDLEKNCANNDEQVWVEKVIEVSELKRV